MPPLPAALAAAAAAGKIATAAGDSEVVTPAGPAAAAASAAEVSVSPFVAFGSGPGPRVSAADHQFLVFLHAIVTAGGAPPCKPASLEVIRYYGEGDTPLGRFLQVRRCCAACGARCLLTARCA
jgi:hypothetical protein